MKKEEDPDASGTRLTGMDEEAAWRAISDAEEELRTKEALAADAMLAPDDAGIPELAITRLMEREMLTRDEAGELAVEILGSPEGVGYLRHAIAKRTGLPVPPRDPCFHPDVS